MKRVAKTVALLMLASTGIYQPCALAAADSNINQTSAQPARSIALINTSLPLPTYLDKMLGNRPESTSETSSESKESGRGSKSDSTKADKETANADTTDDTITPNDGSAGQQLNTLINALMPIAEDGNDQYKSCVKLIAKHSTFGGRLGARASDMLNYATLFKGVSPSSEAGDVILSEKVKLKSVASAKYWKQKIEDDVEQHLVTDVMQMAAAMGEDGTSCEQRSDYKEASANITSLCGAEGLDQTKAFLKEMSGAGSVPPPAAEPWTPNEVKELVTKAVATSSSGDPIIIEIKKDVHHYNKHSKGVMAAHRAVRITLSAASLTPSFVGPAANTILFIYLGISGGTEQEKLLKEMYIDKRLTSRVTLLNEMAHMALHNHQVAQLTHNNLLKGVSELLLARMTGKDQAAALLAMRPQ